MSFRPRSVANVTVIALVGLLGLTACNSQPGHRRVVQDMIDSLTLPADDEQCMKDVLGEYTNDELEQIADENDGLNFSQADAVDSGTEQYQGFVANLRECASGGATAPTDPTESIGPGETTAASDATEVTDTTEVSETTEGIESTDVPETTER